MRVVTQPGAHDGVGEVVRLRLDLVPGDPGERGLGRQFLQGVPITSRTGAEHRHRVTPHAQGHRHGAAHPREERDDAVATGDGAVHVERGDRGEGGGGHAERDVTRAGRRGSATTRASSW